MPGGTYEDNWDLFQPTFANELAYFITFLGKKSAKVRIVQFGNFL